MMKFLSIIIADWLVEKLILTYIMLCDFFERYGFIDGDYGHGS